MTRNTSLLLAVVGTTLLTGAAYAADAPAVEAEATEVAAAKAVYAVDNTNALVPVAYVRVTAADVADVEVWRTDVAPVTQVARPVDNAGALVPVAYVGNAVIVADVAALVSVWASASDVSATLALA